MGFEGLYRIIPHDEGLAAWRNIFRTREYKTISTESLIQLGKCVLKNNVFERNLSYFKWLRGTGIGTKMALPYALILWKT